MCNCGGRITSTFLSLGPVKPWDKETLSDTDYLSPRLPIITLRLIKPWESNPWRAAGEKKKEEVELKRTVREVSLNCEAREENSYRWRRNARRQSLNEGRTQRERASYICTLHPRILATRLQDNEGPPKAPGINGQHQGYILSKEG
jgi:hypothetical protein